MIPRIGQTIQNIEEQAYPSFTFKVSNNHITGNIDGVEALEQTIDHIIHTERYVYAIYPDTYGIEIKRLIGKSREYIKANIRRILQDALTQDDRIYAVSINNVSEIDNNVCAIDFTVHTNIGNLERGLNVNV